MRKNILGWMLAASFVFVVASATNIKASSNLGTSVAVVNNVRSTTDKSQNMVAFNLKRAELSKICEKRVGPGCDAAIALMDAAANTAWGVCYLEGESSQECYDALEWAMGYFDWAMGVCLRELEASYGSPRMIDRKRTSAVITKATFTTRRDAPLTVS